MKFCPECGAVLEDKKICECGYNVETGEVDQTIRQKKNEEINSHLGSYDNIMGTVFIDEIPKEYFNNTGMLSNNPFVQIKINISNYINGMSNIDIEEKLYEIYKNSALTKEVYINALKDILELRTEEHIRNIIEKIGNE